MSCPVLLTPGRIADILGVPLARVLYVLQTRRIAPTARAGILRLYNAAALRRIEDALAEIDARRAQKGGAA